MQQLFSKDIAWVLERTEPEWRSLSGAVFFITGGTGFVGSWLLECLAQAERRFDLGIRARVLSRDPEKFAAYYPHIVASPAIELVAGDVRQLEPDGNNYDVFVHAATDASARLNRDNPLLMADTIVEGTRKTLEFARASAVRRFLMLSSGAVYGKLPAAITHVSEDYPGGPDQLDTYYTYSESKRMAELLCAIHARQFGMQIPIARLFAFVGPRLPLDAHFAVGNFIRDALHGDTIHIGGDGTATRSYLYAAELVVWLLKILLAGESGKAYNVGSDEAVSMRELAETVASLFPEGRKIEIAGRTNASNPINWYVPEISRACHELDVSVSIGLRDALARTIAWHRNESGLNG